MSTGWIRALLLALLVASVPVEADDFHALFEARCQRCHGHAGPFVRARLRLEDGVVKGSRGALDGFLRRHAGGLSTSEVALFIDIFRQQIERAGLYREHCIVCHEPAHEFAAIWLTVRDDRLIGRYSERDISAFLLRHGRLSDAEARLMAELLRGMVEGER